MQALTSTVAAVRVAPAAARAAKPAAAPRMVLKSAPLVARSAFCGAAAPLRAAVSAVESTGVRSETVCKARALSRLGLGRWLCSAPRCATPAPRRSPSRGGPPGGLCTCPAGRLAVLAGPPGGVGDARSQTARRG